MLLFRIQDAFAHLFKALVLVSLRESPLTFLPGYFPVYELQRCLLCGCIHCHLVLTVGKSCERVPESAPVCPPTPPPNYADKARCYCVSTAVIRRRGGCGDYRHRARPLTARRGRAGERERGGAVDGQEGEVVLLMVRRERWCR